MKTNRLKVLLTTAALLAGLALPSTRALADDYEFRTGGDGKTYWYEFGVKQGTLDDRQGILGFGTNRGREIYDPATDAWYWLDSCFDGAKAQGKEVWIPYVYQEELIQSPDGYGRMASGISDESVILSFAASSATSEADMSAQVAAAIRNRSGKWVRYDEKGQMLKGWVKIEGALAQCYADQVGNLYYYDQKTGLMAKGWVSIGGSWEYFDEETGVCQTRSEIPCQDSSCDPATPAESAETSQQPSESTSESTETSQQPGEDSSASTTPSSQSTTTVAPAELEVRAKILALKASYPEAMPWTDEDDHYTSKTRKLDGQNYTISGSGCHAFALICSDAAFDDAPFYTMKRADHSKLRIGDIIRINDDSHTVIVIDHDDSGITVAEGNYGGRIHWGRKIAWSILDSCDYVWTRYTDTATAPVTRPSAEAESAALQAAVAATPGQAIALISSTRSGRNWAEPPCRPLTLIWLPLRKPWRTTVTDPFTGLV